MKKIIGYIVICLISIFLIVFFNNNDFLYKSSIMKINNIKTISDDYDYNDLGIKEIIYKKKISGVITNGKLKSKKISTIYEESYSSVVTEKYKIGDKVFLDKNYEIDGLKRDIYLVYILIVFIIGLFIIGKFRGLLTLFSVIFNGLVFYISLSLYSRGVNLLLLTVISSIIFTTLSLIVASGFNKKTYAAIISVIVSFIILLLLLLLIVFTTKYKGINFNGLSFLTVPGEDIFIEGLLIGCLGAIMDVSITMSSSISELIDKSKDISNSNLYKSSRQIGSDIMPTMINVLFFTYLCSGLPIFVLAIRNGFSVYNYITTNYTLELTRFLSGSIGIVLTIPIATFISIKMFRGGNYE